jgi:hypothetical protein
MHGSMNSKYFKTISITNLKFNSTLIYHHHISVMDLGHLLTRSGLTHPGKNLFKIKLITIIINPVSSFD